MKKKSSKQRLQETMIKTIIKQVLLEMDILSLIKFDKDVQDRMKQGLSNLPEKDQKKLRQEIEQDVVDIIMRKMEEERAKKSASLTPLARTPEERARLGAAIHGGSKPTGN